MSKLRRSNRRVPSGLFHDSCSTRSRMGRVPRGLGWCVGRSFISDQAESGWIGVMRQRAVNAAHAIVHARIIMAFSGASSGWPRTKNNMSD